VKKRQPAYLAYTQLLPDFIEATHRGTKVEVMNNFFPVNYIGDIIPLHSPPVMVSFRGRHVPLDSDSLLAAADARIVDNQGTTCYQLDNPTKEQLGIMIADDVNQRTNCFQDHVNIEGLRMLNLVKRVLTAFLLIHGYPAFSDDTEEEEEAKVSEEPIEKQTQGKKRGRSASQELASVPESAPVTAHPVKAKTVLSQVDMLKYAKPQRINPQPWGSLDELPNADGVYMPFLIGLEKIDETMVPNLLSDFFLRSLGSDSASCFATLERIRASMGVISKTRAGHELAHFCKAVDIGLRAQAQLFPVFDSGVYQGTLISGSQFELQFAKNVYVPAKYADLKNIVTSHSFHVSSLKTIMDLTGVREVMDCRTMRQLSLLLRKSGTRIDVVEEILEAAKRVTFKEEGYWPINPTTLKKFLKALPMYLTVDDIPDDIPMHPTMLFDTDVYASLLSAFGFMVPSFNIPSCPYYELGADKDMPQFFVIARTTIKFAAEQLKKTIQEGFISNGPRNLSKKNKDYPIPAKDAREIWTLLSDIRNPPPTPLPALASATPAVQKVSELVYDF
jgi:hypothetical protein